ncbi:hypothetical protein E1287_21700 [Actinomadura sp. KC06]|uniref:hypothetical protein n=1 Tax=Actinomadura sp. KC06 TaxID=2530369 RepID=UPI00104317F1|nr:hypothetical protein [Actinomadura sp. KC06]TDD32725.1 hypothetical protein E1287_21700 [Actinomadura sp. KC06]
MGGDVARVAATREELARMAVTAERLRTSRELDRSIGRGLSAIAAHSASAAAARSATGTAAVTARALRAARAALDDARAVAAAYRTTPQAVAASCDGSAGRLALRILLVVYAMYLNVGAQFLVATRAGPVEWVVSAGSVAGILLLQLRHVVLRLRGRPVRGRYRTLAALAYVPLVVSGLYWFMPIGLVAASALLLLPRRVAWTLGRHGRS